MGTSPRYDINAGGGAGDATPDGSDAVWTRLHECLPPPAGALHSSLLLARVVSNTRMTAPVWEQVTCCPPPPAWRRA